VEKKTALKYAIARVCHQVNKAYCEAIGDKTQVDWEDAPEWQQSAALSGVEMHIEKPNAGPEASHDAWAQTKIDDGWTYGNEKDPEAKKHPCLIPFDKLPQEQQAKDFIFKSIVHALWHDPEKRASKEDLAAKIAELPSEQQNLAIGILNQLSDIAEPDEIQ